MKRIMTAVCGIALLAVVSPARASDDDAKLRDIVNKAIKAHGGADKLKKYKASVTKIKGKFYGMGEGIDYTGTTSLQLPDRLNAMVEADAGGMTFKFRRIVNGDKGWMQFNDTTQDLEKEMLTEIKEELNSARVTHLTYLLDKDYTLSALGDGKVGDRATVGVRVQRKGYRDVNLYFDKENSRLLKSQRRVKDIMMGGTEYTSDTFYRDYKNVDGMMIAHKVVINRDDKKFIDGEATEVKVYEKLDDKVFAKP